MAIKMGDYEIVVKKGDKELEALPGDLPVFDFEGNAITYEEAKGGYLRQSDYSKKTAEVADIKKLFGELGVQDPTRGVNIVRHLLNTFSELEDLGIIDPATGEIIHDSGQAKTKTGGDDDDTKSSNQNAVPQSVQREFQAMKNRLANQERDIGALLAMQARRDLKAAFPDFTDEMEDWVFAMARDNPEKSPMEYARALDDQFKARGQKAVDEHEEAKKKEALDALTREPAKDAIEMFGEDVKFTYRPQHQPEGTKSMSPTEAAMAYMEAAQKAEE